MFRTQLMELLRSRKLGIIAVFLVILGSFMLAATFIPVMIVEAKYQTLKTLENTFGTTELARLILPQISFNLGNRTKYKDYGITIPTLHLDEPVVFNVDPNDQAAYTAALKNGIAHASATSFPDNPGLGYYFAHSSNPEFRSQYNAVFYLLGKLKEGDDVYIWHEGQDHHYQVTHQTITDPSNTAFLTDTYDGENIVLQTCWPPGTTQQRLLVFAKRVELQQ
jgi:LPXTG-site transpeptidase (sortase) family protein